MSEKLGMLVRPSDGSKMPGLPSAREMKSVTFDEFLSSHPADEQVAIQERAQQMKDMSDRLTLLLQALPESMRDTDVDETPCGSWILEWCREDARLSVYLSTSGRIGYAHLAPNARSHGEFDCILPDLPPEIAAALVGDWQIFRSEF